MENKKIEEQEIKVIGLQEGERMSTKIRIVKWIVDGKAYGPMLEKRQFSKTEHGIRMGKAKGFSMADLNLIVDKWEDVTKAMEGKVSETKKEDDVKPADNW